MRSPVQRVFFCLSFYSLSKYPTVAWSGMLRFAQHDNRGVGTGPVERSRSILIDPQMDAESIV